MIDVAEGKLGSARVTFYTTGDALTELVRNFVREGSYEIAYQILKDGGMNKAQIKSFFLFELIFIGDTRKGDLSVVSDKSRLNKQEISEIFTTGICTSFNDYKLADEEGCFMIEFYQWRSAQKKPNYNKNFTRLLKIFSFEEIRDVAGVEVLSRCGYHEKKDAHGESKKNGVILQNGEYITCGFQDHINLYPILYELGFSNSSDWTDDALTFHVSEGQLIGKLTSALDNDYRIHEEIPTDAQLKSLFFFKEHITTKYGSFNAEPTAELLRRNIEIKESHGGKYNNLVFLKTYYPEINLPRFSKEKLDGVKLCIRTSPKQSMPGLLSSKFEITENSILEIENEFKECIKLTGKIFDKNELYYFYQEFLEGRNGVCHYWSKINFKYSYSETRGDVVKGLKNNNILPAEMYKQLRKICSALFEDLKNPIQLEFVISDEKLYIVQLRLLKNNPSDFGVTHSPMSKVLVSGKTFSTGSEYEKTSDITINDILIVDSDAESKELIGKKALIVKSDVEFSHILALSKSLHIPSIFNTGDIDVSKLTGSLNFCSKNEDGWITKN